MAVTAPEGMVVGMRSMRDKPTMDLQDEALEQVHVVAETVPAICAGRSRLM